MISTVLQNGAIVDGSGRSAFKTDVAIVGDRIVLIGDLGERDAHHRIDCRGKIIAPGLIDSCSHTNDSWLTVPGVPSKIFQGVTTEIGGMCGRSFPNYGDGTEWPTRESALTNIESQRTAVNVAFFAAAEQRRVPIDPRTAIEACEEGALGLSVDLRLPLQPDARAALSRTLRAARDAGSPRCAVHLPFEPDDTVEALEIALELASECDVALHVSHHHVAYPHAHANVHRTLEIMSNARNNGTTVSCDCYPYVATSKHLAALLPAAMRDASEDAFAKLDDQQFAAAVAMEMQLRWGERWSSIMLAEVGSEQNMAWCGSRIDDIARAWRLSPARTVVQLLRDERTAAKIFVFALSEDDVATVLSAPFTSIGSAAPAMRFDAGAVFGSVHPRVFGTFPRVYGRFVRGRKTLKLEEAVRRMTSLPATAFDIRDRGEIAVGMYADIVIFDEGTIRDTATYEHPFSAPLGIEHVIVNGTPVMRDGVTTNEQPGTLLRGGRSTR